MMMIKQQQDLAMNEKKLPNDSNKVSNYREIGFSPVSSAQSDSCSNSNHTSESSNISTVNSKLTQVGQIFILQSIISSAFQTEISGSINSTSDELEAKNSQIQTLTRVSDDEYFIDFIHHLL